MDRTADLSTREISTSRLKLADELLFTPQPYGSEIYYHIEAPSQGKFFRIGYPEYVFLSLLDGTMTVAQALTITARTLGAQALTQAEGIQVACWLLENELAQFTENGSGWSTRARSSSHRARGLLQHFHPFWIKVPLGSPDRLLATLSPALGWLFCPAAMLAGIALILLAVSSVASHGDEFTAKVSGILMPHNWLWMALVWLGLKIVHELAHGLACKHHGGEVREMGVILILFAPLAYVDVTSSWRFPSKWQRMHVAAAGMYVELLLAAVAAITWVRIDSAIIRHLLYHVIVMAGISTLLFNANPLMRFDGYYILADLLGIPNLAAEGNRFLKVLFACLFYGVKMRPAQVLGFRLWCVRGYGLASAAWRLLVCVSLVTAASVLMHGAGLVLAGAGLVGWFGLPLVQLVVDLERRFHEARPSFVRAVTVVIVFSAAVATVLLGVPWPGALTAPVVVQYADLSLVRTRTAGFIQQVHVVDGQPVQAGQLLLQLRNDDLKADERELELALEQGRVRHRMALDEQNVAQAQIALRDLQAVQERLAEVRRQSEGLRVRAPVAGRIVARNIDQRVGSYVHEGAEILAVGDEGRKELIVSVAQEETEAIERHVGQRARFRINGRAARWGRLERLEPRASSDLPHPAMSSTVGGPLSVMENNRPDQVRLRLVEPRLRGVICLSPQTCHDLGVGQRGYAMFGVRRESIGQFVWVRFCRWCESLRPS